MQPPKFTPEADADIVDLNIHGMLTYAVAHTDVYMRRLRQAIDLYAENPLAAAQRGEVRPPVRMFRTGAHPVFYDIVGDGIMVLRILHHSVDWIDAF